MKAKKQRVILFQGDSITDGNRGRNEDPNHIMGHGYAFLIAAKLGAEKAAEQPLFINRGVSGDRASDLYARWNEDCISLQPDILSILVGVNDIWRSMKGEASGVTDRYARAYRHLLEETKEVLPDTALVLCEPFVLNTGAPAEDWAAWQERLQAYQKTVRDLAAEFGAVHVELQRVFDDACKHADAAYWLWDGVHPTVAGHQLVADAWLKAVEQAGLKS